MKTSCPYCGVHFGDEFEKTLKCGFWGFSSFALVPPKFRRRVWDLMMTTIADEMYEDSGVQMILTVDFVAAGKRAALKNIVPGYKKMSDEDRRELQRQLATVTDDEAVSLGGLMRKFWAGLKTRLGKKK